MTKNKIDAVLNEDNHECSEAEKIVFRKIDEKVHVLGKSNKKYRHYIIHDAKTGNIIYEDSFKKTDISNTDPLDTVIYAVCSLGYSLLIKERIRKNDEYRRKRDEFEKANLADLEKAVKDIKVYQGTIEGVERIDTGKPETFIKAKDTFWLRVKAYNLGADAVINYQPGSSIGTPVKYKK